MTEINVYKIGKSPEELQAALMNLRSEYDAHIHDGVSSKTFQTTIADTISTRTLLIRKLSYTDNTNGLWMGLVGNLMKLNLGSATNYLKWDGTALTISGSITAATITGSTIQTALTGARIVMDAGNDISLYDPTTGSGGTISGNTAAIKFIKDADNTKLFTMQKRAGKDSSNDNVWELFASASPTGYHNFIFIGEDGMGGNENVGTVSISANKLTAESQNVNNGNIQMGLSENGGGLLANFLIRDTRVLYADNAKTGTTALLIGSGTYGFAGFGWRVSSSVVNVGLYQGSSSLMLGITMLVDTDNAYDLGSAGTAFRSIYASTRIQSVIGYFTGKITGETDIEAYIDITVGRMLKMGQIGRTAAEAIANPANGWIYYDTTNNVVRCYINSTWKTLAVV